MCQVFFCGISSFVISSYVPDPVALLTLKGPSHGLINLCLPSFFWMSLRTESLGLRARGCVLLS